MRRLIFTALAAAMLWGCAGEEALAQGCGPQNPNCIVPTAPPGTNNNQAASTAFVIQNGGGGGGATGVPMVGDCTLALISGNALITCTQTAGVPFGTLATVNGSTGTSGHAIPFLDGTNIWSAPQTLSGNPLLNLIGTGNVNVSNLAQNTIQFQGQGNSLTTAIHINPGSGTLPTGTISEFVGERTNTQAFGGNYGRWSYSNLGSAQGNISGIIGEFGGTTATGAMGPYLLQVGIENPPATFTVFEGWRFYTAPGISEDDTQGGVAFGNGATVPRTQIMLNIANIGGAGTRNSHSLQLEGKANNGTERAVWWRQNVNVTSNAGVSCYRWQQSLNVVGTFSTPGTLCDNGDFIATGRVQTGAVAVASLPACAAGLQGARLFVTDQNTAIAYHGAVTGGGANKQAVVCDGTAWYQD